MLAVYRKELKLRFFSVWTYVFLFFTLLSFGILSSVFNLSLGYASLSYPLGYMTLLLALLLPFFVFWGHKKRPGDERLLLSLPLSPTSIVLGDFFSSLTVLLIPFSIFALLPLLFTLFGGGDSVATSLVSLLGCFLYAVFLLCAVRCIFYIIKRPLPALGVSLLFTLALYFLNSVFFFLPFEESGVFQRLSSLLNPTGLYYSFTYGKINLYGCVYFVTFILLFLCLQILFLKRQKGELSNSKKRLSSIISSILLVVCVLVSNLLTAFLPERIAYRDVSGNDISYISGTSLDKLHALDEPITLYLLSKGGMSRADQEILSFLRRYTEESSFLRLEVVDTQKEPSFSLSHTTKDLKDQSLIVEGKNRSYCIDSADLYYYYNEDLGVLPSDYYNYLISSYVKYLESASMQGLDETSVQLGYHLYYSNSTVAYFNGDSLLINAILFVSSPKVRHVYIADTDTFTLSNKDTAFEESLSQNKFSVSHLHTVEIIPSDCDYLVLFSPKKDLTQKEKQGIEAYLDRGGNLFLTTHYASCDLPVLSSLLSSYGLAPVAEGIVCETEESRILSAETPYYFSATIDPSVFAKDFEGIYLSLLSHPIRILHTEDTVVRSLLSTTEAGALMDPTEKELLEKDTSYTVGALSEKGDASLFWLSSHLSVSSTANDLSSGNNLLYVLSVMDDLCPEKEDTISVSPILMTASSLTLSDGDLALWTLVIAALIPLLFLSIGIIFTYSRKKRT